MPILTLTESEYVLNRRSVYREWDAGAVALWNELYIKRSPNSGRGTPETKRKQRRDCYIRNYESEMWQRARKRAWTKGIPFDIDVSDIIIPENCPILGIKLIKISEEKFGRCPNSPSLDRIVNDKGYVKGNVHVISFRANNLKNNSTKDEILKLAEWFKAST